MSAPATATLRILAAPAVELIGRTFPVPPQGCSVGREPGNDLVLRDDAASRRHARFDPTGDGGWEVVDNGSGNGLWVNDQRVTRHRLADGDLVQIGHTKLQFVAPPLAAPQWAATQLALAPPVAAACPRCGNPLPAGSRFCGHCGAAAPSGPVGAAAPPGGSHGWPPAAGQAGPLHGPVAAPPVYPPGYPPGAAPYPGPGPAAPYQGGGPPPAPPYAIPGATPPYHAPPHAHGAYVSHTPGQPPPGYAQPPMSHAPAPAAARRGPSGCAIGCFVLSLLLFFGTVAGSVWALHRTGHLRLPGVASAAGPPG